MIELKPCPFCGGKAFLAEYDYKFDTGYVPTYGVECTGCNAAIYDCDTEEEAAEAWNRRV